MNQRSRFRRHSEMVHKVHNYFVADPLAKGSFSLIYYVYQQKTFHQCAMKLILKRKIEDTELGKLMIFNESVLLPIIKHPQIIDVKETIETSTKIMEIMDVFEHGDLSTFIESHHLSEARLLCIIDQILAAVEYLHGLFICHRDIKPNNILVGKNSKVVLTDFGLADFCFETKKMNCGSYGYTAPEVNEGKEYDGRMADVWSIGVLIYTLFTKIPPNTNGFNLNDMDEALLPNDVADLVKFILKVNPNERPSVKQIRNHKAFNNIMRAPTQTLPDFSLPLKDVNQEIIYNLCKLLQKDINLELNFIEKLKTEKPTKEKVLYFLMENYLESINYGEKTIDKTQSFDNVSNPSPNFSTQTPFSHLINDFDNKKVKTIKTRYTDSWISISNSILKCLLNMNFCASLLPSKYVTLIYNTPSDDVHIKFRVEPVSDKLCDVIYEVDENQISYINDIDSNLSHLCKLSSCT